MMFNNNLSLCEKFFFDLHKCFSDIFAVYCDVIRSDRYSFDFLAFSVAQLVYLVDPLHEIKFEIGCDVYDMHVYNIFCLFIVMYYSQTSCRSKSPYTHVRN